MHLVFPRAEALLRYKDSFTSVAGDRLAPPIHFADGSFLLRRPSKGLEIPLDDRIDAYPELLYPAYQPGAGPPPPIGKYFVKHNENLAPRPAAPGSPDPDIVGRGYRAHEHTCNALAAHLKSLGIRPLEQEKWDPPFDLAWRKEGTLYVAEVKSLTRENEAHQLRLGLGQLLYYSHLLRKRADHVVPVLTPEREPRDPEWAQLCNALSIRLAFPPDFEALIDPTA